MIEQHTTIVNSNDSDFDKISQLWELCEHLYKVLDEVQESHKDALYLESVCRRMTAKKFHLKIDQVGTNYKATFWKSKGDGVETYHANGENLIDVIERAGTEAGSQDVIQMIRNSYKDLGLELRD